MMDFLAFFELSGLYRMLGIASELLLLPVFLWPTRPAPRRWPLLLAFLAVFELVTWFSVESTFFDMVGLVLIRLAIFALVLLCVYRLQPVCSMVLAMVYFLLTMPLRWMVTAAVLFLPYSPLAGFAPVVWLAEYLPLRSLLYFLLQLLCILLCQRKTPALAIETGNRVNWVMCPALIAFYLYLRYDLKYLGFNERTRLFDLLMVLTAFLGLVLITVLAQYVFILQRQRMEQSNIIRLGQEQYQSVLTQKEMSDSMMKLAHDMKHHLSTIAALAGDDGKVREYIQSVRGALEEAECAVHTGDALLDSLLGTRMRRAREEGVAMTVAVDFAGCDFLNPVDVCAIFCNGVDNALEASAQVPRPENRHILVKAGLYRGAVLIRISNYYEHSLRQDGERLLTTKSQKELHGIGLSSIRYSAEKYGGAMELSRTKHIFTLRVLIPKP